jgi:hypothetical protein
VHLPYNIDMAKAAKADFEGQIPGEEVVLLFRKHPVVMRKGLVIGSVGLLVGPLLTTLLTSGSSCFALVNRRLWGSFLGRFCSALYLRLYCFFLHG